MTINNKKEFELPSKRKITMRTEIVADDIQAMKFATEGLENKDDRQALFFLMQKIKLGLAITHLDGKDIKISSFKEYEALMNKLMENPLDYKVADIMFVKLNGDATEAETYVKNLLNAQVSVTQ